jgi:hypothetical protein
MLYGNYRTKRNISMTDSTENDVSLEHKISITHYLCFNSQRPRPPNDTTSPHIIHSSEGGAVCLGIFVLKGDANLYPSFRDIATLNAIDSTRANYSTAPNSLGSALSSAPRLLLMLSAPRTDHHQQKQQQQQSDVDWIYNIKHACFAYTPRTDLSQGSGASFSTARLVIPSLAPDLLGEFAGAACLDTGRGRGGRYQQRGEGVVRSGGSSSSDDSGGYESSSAAGLLGRQVAAMAASGMTQVVESELLAAGLIESIEVLYAWILIQQKLHSQWCCFIFALLFFALKLRCSLYPIIYSIYNIKP